MSYFPLDTQLDDRVEIIRSRYGNNGFACLILIWMKIYRQEGYYMHWDEDAIDLFNSQEAHWDRKKLTEMVSECIERELFSSEKYKQFRILTSAAIQTRYLQYKRGSKALEIEKNLLCVQNVDKNFENVNLIVRKFDSNVGNDITILNYTKYSDDDKEFSTIDFSTFNKKIRPYFLRDLEVYQDGNKINDTIDVIYSVMNSFTDVSIIQKINNCSSKEAYNIWTKAMEIINPFNDTNLPIANREGYLRKTIENMFRGGYERVQKIST